MTSNDELERSKFEAWYQKLPYTKFGPSLDSAFKEFAWEAWLARSNQEG